MSAAVPSVRGEGAQRRVPSAAAAAAGLPAALRGWAEALEAEGLRCWPLSERLLLVRDEVGQVPELRVLWPLLQRLPEPPRLELVAPGVLRAMASPGAKHQYAARKLQRLLDDQEGEMGPLRWWFEWERGLLLGGRLLVPDGCGWRLGEGDEVPPPWTEPNPIERVPEWVLEVLSEGTAGYDRGVKASYYAEAGVPWLWLLEPERRLLQVLHLTERGSWQLVSEQRGEHEVLLPPFDSPVALASLWRPAPRPRRG